MQQAVLPPVQIRVPCLCNNTITGESFDHLIYPEFKGYHANVYWATLESDRVPFTVYSESDGLFFRVFTPLEPVHRRNGENTMWEFPEGASASDRL